MYAYSEVYLKEVVATLDAEELWNYFCKTENYIPIRGNNIKGFSADWMGQFYAYFQWHYNITSKKVGERIEL